jgi:hypothetical protein
MTITMNAEIIDTTIDAQELTLVDIEELRRALGAEAAASSEPSDGDDAVSTVMCPQWY